MNSTADLLSGPTVEEAVMNGDATSHRIVERTAELVAADEFLEDVRVSPTMLVFTGEIGIGKSTLWLEALRLARECSYHVLVSRPVESETTLPFAALGDLFEPFPDETFLPLPRPQRQALMTALLRTEASDSPFHQRAVALATLGTLRALSAGQPVVIAIDDVHWLDESSARVLEFALRRLDGEAVGALLSWRTGVDSARELSLAGTMPAERTRSFALERLGDSAIDEILERQLEVTLAQRDLLRLREGAGGNPYYALELARALTRNDPTARAGAQLPIPHSLRELARQRLSGLPAAVHEFALLVSALSHPRIELLAAATGSSPDELDHLASARAAGVLEIDGQAARFTHPLLSSVIDEDTPAPERRTLHGRLADLLDDAEERARHLALAVDEPDEAIARELEEAARLARGRGAPESAAELVERARELTPPELRESIASRCILAADYHFESGSTSHARALLEQALAVSSQGPGRARALIPLAWAVVTEQGFRNAVPLFEEAASQAGDDIRAQTESHRGLSWCEQHDGTLASAAFHARAAADLSSTLDDPALLACSLADCAFLDFLMGKGIPHETMNRALALERESMTRLGIMGRPSWIHGMILEFAGELEAAQTTLEEHHAHALEIGDEQAVPFILNHLGRVALLSGDWPAALERSEA
ncbi:MAG: AAA family ATPase, partial [Gaiellaceae bacterium]